MQSFAQETTKIRKNRRKEKRSSKLPPLTISVRFWLKCIYALLQVWEASWMGSCMGWSASLQLRSFPGCSVSLVRDVAPQSPLPGCSDGCSPPHPQRRHFGPSAGTELQPRTTLRVQTSCVCSSGQTWAVPSEAEGRISSRGITQPTFQRLRLTKLPFEQAFSFT